MKIKQLRTNMTLQEYINEQGIKKYKLAENIGLSVRTITSICKGVKVSIATSKMIELYTNGAVKAVDIQVGKK